VEYLYEKEQEQIQHDRQMEFERKLARARVQNKQKTNDKKTPYFEVE
jgi:hypothetical protein